MERTTQKALKNLVKMGVAEDITTLSFADGNALREKEHGTTTIEISRGVYGLNGALIKGNESGKLYAITARNSTLAQMV
jgi:hypothetical protein